MSDDQTPTIRTFADLDLHPLVRKGIDEAGFVEPMPIQAKSLPITLEGKDIIGQAQTGSGKTAAFLIATYHCLLSNEPGPERRPEDPRALMIAPTRELVKQISENAEVIGKHTGLELHTVFGGIDYREQRDRFKEGVDVLVGTPGRLIDYFKQKAYRLDQLEVLVIDECDRMFDMGFIDDVRWMIRHMPKMQHRQNLLFSATVDYRVEELAWEYMDNPPMVAVDPNQSPPDKIKQSVYHVARHEKDKLMVGLLRQEILTDPDARVLIFSNTRGGCLKARDVLEANGIPARALSGALSQEQRFKALNAFKQEKPPVVVATDVASRGLHIEGVTHVINYDVPDNAKDYTHRIGRTARAGAEGEALILASEDTVENLLKIEDDLDFKIDVVWPSEDQIVDIKRPPRRPRDDKGRGGKGGPRGRGGGGGGKGRRGGQGGSNRGGRGHSGHRGGRASR